jgi:hypothetical protein
MTTNSGALGLLRDKRSDSTRQRGARDLRSVPNTASKPARPRSRRLTGSMVLAGLVAGALLTGCSTPHIADMSPQVTNKAEAAVPKTTPVAHTATIVKPKVRPTGDLAKGSLVRKLDAGALSLAVNYWSDQKPETWSADKAVVLRLSAHLERKGVISPTAVPVKISRFWVTLDDGTSVSTLVDDRGEFVITPPYSYGSALTIRPANKTATSAIMSVEFDLLIETTPTSKAYFRQTVLDTVSLHFVKNGS